MSVLEGACNANLISLRVHETGNASKQQYAAFYDLLTIFNVYFMYVCHGEFVRDVV